MYVTVRQSAFFVCSRENSSIIGVAGAFAALCGVFAGTFAASSRKVTLLNTLTKCMTVPVSSGDSNAKSGSMSSKGDASTFLVAI